MKIACRFSLKINSENILLIGPHQNSVSKKLKHFNVSRRNGPKQNKMYKVFFVFQV